MERDENGIALTAINLCKHCGETFTTLEDEKHDECFECIDFEEEKQ